LIDPAPWASRPAAGRDCGTCTLCCKVYEVPAVESAAGTWCRHCQPGRGCGIHETRPRQCRAFFCLWMTRDFLGPDWKPEKSRFVLTMDPATRWLFAQVDPGAASAWRKEPYYGQFKRWAAASRQPVVVFVNQTATAVLPDSDVPLGIIAADERLVLRELPGARLVVEKRRIDA
jgi:hypothetical protein